MTLSLFIEIIGWVGALLILAAFALSSYQYLLPTSRIYQLLNLAGSSCLIANSAYHANYQFTFINTVWAIVAIVGLFKAFVPKKTI